MNVEQALSDLLDRWVALYRSTHGTLPRQPFELEWPSPCQRGQPDRSGYIEWLPVRRTTAPDFTGLERALERDIHPDIKQFVGTFYAEVIAGKTSEGGVQLVQIWNDADFDRLIENTLGHALAKFRNQQDLTLFFATTDEDEYFLSIDNDSGAVLLESPGLAPIREVARDIATFLTRVEPVVSSPSILEDGPP